MARAIRNGPRATAAGFLCLFLLAGPAVAQPTAGPTQNAAPSAGTGVLHPPGRIDPGMSRPAPPIPKQSTPVIHPRSLRHSGQGTVKVVPK